MNIKGVCLLALRKTATSQAPIEILRIKMVMEITETRRNTKWKRKALAEMRAARARRGKRRRVSSEDTESDVAVMVSSGRGESSDGGSEVAEPSGGDGEVAESSSGHIEVGGSSSGHIEVGGSSSGHIDVGGSSSRGREVAEPSGEHIEVGGSSGGSREVAEPSGGHIEVGGSSGGGREVAESSGGHIEVGGSSGGGREVEEPSGGRVEVGGSSGGGREVAEPNGGRVEVGELSGGGGEVGRSSGGLMEQEGASSGFGLSDIEDERSAALMTMDLTRRKLRAALMIGLFLSYPLTERCWLLHCIMKRQNMKATDAVREAASFVGFNEWTVQNYNQYFFANHGQFPETKRGMYSRQCFLQNETAFGSSHVGSRQRLQKGSSQHDRSINLPVVERNVSGMSQS